jgi:ribosomal protein S2
MLGCLFLRFIGWTLGNAPKINVREYRMEQSKEDNPEKLTTQEEEKLNKNTTQYVWTPLYTNKHK